MNGANGPEPSIGATVSPTGRDTGYNNIATRLAPLCQQRRTMARAATRNDFGMFKDNGDGVNVRYPPRATAPLDDRAPAPWVRRAGPGAPAVGRG